MTTIYTNNFDPSLIKYDNKILMYNDSAKFVLETEYIHLYKDNYGNYHTYDSNLIEVLKCFDKIIDTKNKLIKQFVNKQHENVHVVKFKKNKWLSKDQCELLEGFKIYEFKLLIKIYVNKKYNTVAIEIVKLQTKPTENVKKDIFTLWKFQDE